MPEARHLPAHEPNAFATGQLETTAAGRGISQSSSVSRPDEVPSPPHDYHVANGYGLPVRSRRGEHLDKSFARSSQLCRQAPTLEPEGTARVSRRVHLAGIWYRHRQQLFPWVLASFRADAAEAHLGCTGAIDSPRVPPLPQTEISVLADARLTSERLRITGGLARLRHRLMTPLLEDRIEELKRA